MEGNIKTINVNNADTFMSFSQSDLKTVCATLASRLDSISLNHTWSPYQYRESEEEERDHQIVNDAIEILDYFSKIL